jgi:DNA-binding CsgD family transcriptional regulator
VASKPVRGPVIDRARILHLKAQGMKNYLIAARLGCSRQTVYEALRQETDQMKAEGKETGHAMD